LISRAHQSAITIQSIEGWPVTTSDPRATAADSQQAAYFRAELGAQRQLLRAAIGKRTALISRPSEAHRRRWTSVKSAEAELRYIDRLIAGIDSRFQPEQACG